MNIQQEVGHVKKGWVRKSTKDEYLTEGGSYQKRGGLGMSTRIQPGRHEYQLSQATAVVYVAGMNSSYMQQRQQNYHDNEICFTVYFQQWLSLVFIYRLEQNV